MRFQRGLLALSLLILLGLSACAALLKPPTFALNSVELVRLGWEEQRFTLGFVITNPNPQSLHIEALDYSLEINGSPFAKGESTPGLDLPAQGDAHLEIPATTRLVSFLRQAKSLSGAKLPYHLTGTVQVSGLGRLPFSKTGEFNLGKLVPQLP